MLSRKQYVFSILILIVILIMLFSGCTKASKEEFNSLAEIEALFTSKTLFATLEKNNYAFLLFHSPFNDSYVFNIVSVQQADDSKMRIIGSAGFTFAMDSLDNFVEPKELTVSKEYEGFIAEFSFLDTNSKNYENSGNDFSEKDERMKEISGLPGVYYSYVFSN